MNGIDAVDILRSLPSFFLIGALVSVVPVLPDFYFDKLCERMKGKRGGKIILILKQIFIAFKPICATLLLVLNFYIKLDGVIRLAPLLAFLLGYLVCRYSLCTLIKSTAHRALSGCKKRILSLLLGVKK